MDLSFHDHRIDYVTDVIHRNKPFQRHFSCFGIHLYDSNMGAVRIGKVCRIIEAAEIKPRLYPLWIVVGHIRCKCNIPEANTFIRPLHRPAPVGILEVFHCRFQLMGCDFCPFLQHFVQAPHNSTPPHCQGPGTVGAHSKGYSFRISVYNLYIFQGNA